MSNCEVIKSFGSLDLESKSYGLLSLASHLAAHAKSRTNTLRIGMSLSRLDRALRAFLADVHEAMEGKKKAEAVSSEAEAVTPQSMRATADTLEQSSRVIDYIYEASRRAHLTNNSRINCTLVSLQKHGEELRDLAEWLETVADQQYVKNAFNRAAQERESGELYDLSQVD